MNRVLGPYQSGNGFRLVIVIDSGVQRRRKSLVLHTLAEAQAKKLELLRGSLDLFYLRDALTEYIASLAARGVLAQTCEQTQRQLAQFLPLGQPVSALQPADAKRLYQAETTRRKHNGKTVAVDTHHLLLRRTKQFYAWLVAGRHLEASPFADVRPIGRPKRGKLQLRIDEARRFVQVALRHAQTQDVGATAAVMQVYLGLRPTEAMVRQVRDLDDDGRILWVPHGKTESARRRLAVPEALQPILRSQAAGKGPEAPLLGPVGQPAHTRHALRYRLRQLCDEAQVPRVCPHSLRGLAATLALQAGALGQDVARALGHASFGTTARHYADQSTLANAQLRGIHQVLEQPAQSAVRLPTYPPRKISS